MKIGIDYYNTISQYPDFFRNFARTLIDGGAEVYIISAVGDRRLEKTGGRAAYAKEIEAFNIPHYILVIIHFDDQEDIPRLKYEVCQRNKIDLMIDDRPETIEYFHSRGMPALQILKPIK